MMLFAMLMGCGGGVSCDDGQVREGTSCVAYISEDPVVGSGVSPLRNGVTWQWQITEAVDTSVDVEVYDVDLFELTPAVHDAVRARGSALICYFSAGSYEPWTADAASFSEAVIGRRLDGWPDERWLDIMDPGVRAAMEARLDLAVEKGCDGVEPDNVTAYTSASGFRLNASEQLSYNRFLADEAHERGLSVALKNDVEQIPELVEWFDFTVNEECADYNECDTLQPFIDADKAVLNAEYVTRFEDAAAKAADLCPALAGVSRIIKEWDLGPQLVACP